MLQSPISSLDELITIIIKDNCNKIFNYIPQKIKIIHFCGNFNQSVDNVPITIYKLNFSSAQFKQPLNNLPISIIELVINMFNEHSLNNLPNSIKIITIYNYHVNESLNLPIKFTPNKYDNTFLINYNLPNSLEELTIIYREIEHINNFTSNNLPSSIKILKFIFNFSLNFNIFQLKLLPPTINNLSMIKKINKRNMTSDVSYKYNDY